MRDGWRRPIGGAIAVCLAIAMPAEARLLPAELTASFTDRDAQNATPAKSPAPACAIAFTLADERSSPQLAGVIGKRAVKAPADGGAWLRAVLAGFPRRGIAPQSDAAQGHAPSVRLALRTAWIDSSVETYNATVVIAVHGEASDAAPVDRTYRGRASRTAYWSGGVDTLQSAIDGAFANALDQMAIDLKPLCGA
jgi:hypothetical protein